MKGLRLDLALTRGGHARSRTHAQRIIAEGRALVDGERVDKPSHPVPPGAEIAVSGVPDGVEYASRAAHKLAGALDVLGIDPAGRQCLDAGASTGGFTDILLRRGAASVIAVDIGHGQLAAHLVGDGRVEVRDGTSIRDLDAAFVRSPRDLVVADLSFISLRTVLEPLRSVVRPDGELLLMVKPQFEVGRERLPRTGVVTDPALQRDAVAGVVAAAQGIGLRLLGVGASPLPGQEGNREFFVHLRNTPPGSDAAAAACAMIERALAAGTERSAPRMHQNGGW